MRRRERDVRKHHLARPGLGECYRRGNHRRTFVQGGCALRAKRNRVENVDVILGCMLLLLWHEREALVQVLWISQSGELKSTKLHWIIQGLVLLFVVGQIIAGTLIAPLR